MSREPSKIERAIGALRKAADELEHVPACLRDRPALILTIDPGVTPAKLRDKADRIEERADEARAALERHEEPF
jgi:hypothetical protein